MRSFDASVDSADSRVADLSQYASCCADSTMYFDVWSCTMKHVAYPLENSTVYFSGLDSDVMLKRRFFILHIMLSFCLLNVNQQAGAN